MRRFAVIGHRRPVLGIVRARSYTDAFNKAVARFGKDNIDRLRQLHATEPDEDDE